MRLAAGNDICYIRKMTRADAETVCSWRYEGLREVYNTEKSEESIREFLDGTHFALSRKFGGPIEAFINLGPMATVPVPEAADIYRDESYTDIALGLAPELCGKGLGRTVVLAAMELAAYYFPGDGFRVTVAPDNAPALSIYRALGFGPIAGFDAEVIYPDNNETIRTKVLHMEILTAPASAAERAKEKFRRTTDQ